MRVGNKRKVREHERSPVALMEVVPRAHLIAHRRFLPKIVLLSVYREAVRALPRHLRGTIDWKRAPNENVESKDGLLGSERHRSGLPYRPRDQPLAYVCYPDASMCLFAVMCACELRDPRELG
jgi:hypothetical protein